MLALPIRMSANKFPYAALLERPISHSKKLFHRQDSLQIQPLRMNNTEDNTSAVAQVEWKPEHFPHKMYDLLEDVQRKRLDNIVSWLPDGKSFKIHSQIGFEQSIMPLYFSGMSSYKSFRRQLNLYGIYQHRHRPNQDANAYSHELLIRGQRHLCDKIARKKTNPPNKSKLASSSPKTDFKTEKSNKKRRNRSSLLAAMEQRNIKSDQETPSVSGVRKSTNSMGLIQRNMLMKAIYDNEFLTRPNPVDLAKIAKVRTNNTFNRTVNETNNVFESFMGQYWEDLPKNISSAQVVAEIVATFRRK